MHIEAYDAEAARRNHLVRRWTVDDLGDNARGGVLLARGAW
jgi:hypothetical protein